MDSLKLGTLDYAILLGYLALVLAVGWFIRRFTKTSGDFFLAGRSIPAWAAALAFISANCGATEVVGIAACGAKYGMMTSHFYWLGAIPAMVFLGLFMMPFYYGSKARSVPEYLRLRFDEKTRTLNAVSFALMTVLVSGISMYASAKLLGSMLGWGFDASLLVSASIVLVYVVMGGLTSAIYNEVLQFLLIVVGFSPLAVLALDDVGGWTGLASGLRMVAQSQPGAYSSDTFAQMWQPMASAAQNPMGVEWFGMVMGLGFVLSFGYWCTDFLVVQRAMAAKSMTAARQTPLLACFPKILFPILVVLPGMIAIALTVRSGGGFQLPAKDGAYDYDMVIPLMLAHYYRPGLLASFMSGMAGNVTAFNTVWTYDLYQAYIAPKKSDQHYFWMGQAATVVGILVSIGAAYFASMYNNAMDIIQLVFGFVNAPLFATFLLGMFWARCTGTGAFLGLFGGIGGSALFHACTTAVSNLDASGRVVNGMKGGYLGVVQSFPSEMAQNFWLAGFAFVVCFTLTLVISLVTRRTKTNEELKGLVYSLTPKIKDEGAPWYLRPAVVGTALIVGCVILNIIFW